MIRFLFDECLPEYYVGAVRAWNDREGMPFVDFVRVGYIEELPRRTIDPKIIRWAERELRIIVTVDYNTMPSHLADHLAQGGHSPGVFCVRPGASPMEIAFELAMAAHAGREDEFADSVTYIPL